MPGFTIEGNSVRAVSAEGQVAEMTVTDFIAAINRPRMSSCGLALPTGTRMLYQRGRVAVLVHETPPHVRTLRWIANGSHKRWDGAKYRTVRLALPYLVVLAVFEDGLISGRNECFFRTAPLEHGSNELFYPALLNCSRFNPPDGHPLSWICTQKMDRSPAERVPDYPKRIRIGLGILMRLLLETGFNFSSDDHEFSSWFTESTRVDPRIATVEKWQAASEQDPLFVMDVPWLPTGLSVDQVVQRIFHNCGLRETEITCDNDLARIVFNHQKGRNS